MKRDQRGNITKLAFLRQRRTVEGDPIVFEADETGHTTNAWKIFLDRVVEQHPSLLSYEQADDLFYVTVKRRSLPRTIKLDSGHARPSRATTVVHSPTTPNTTSRSTPNTASRSTSDWIARGIALVALVTAFGVGLMERL